MDRDLLTRFPIVLAVARRGGFASAAAALNMSPSAVSHAVRAVEDRLGQPLFVRTTRSVALTEAGASFVASIGPALATVEESIERLRAAKGQVVGLLRLNAPRVALPLAITPMLVAMSRLYPDLTIEVTADDGLVDIVECRHARCYAGRLSPCLDAKGALQIRKSPPVRLTGTALLHGMGFPPARNGPCLTGGNGR